MKTIQHTEESICRSYVTAVAAIARQNLWIGSEHDYGVDGTIKLVEDRAGRRRETGFALDFQAKASTQWALEEDCVCYDLEAKAFNDLVERANNTRCVPFFLVLLTLPQDESDWVEIDEERILLRRCAYFCQLAGEETENGSTKRVRIPREKMLTPEALSETLMRIKTGEIF